MNRRKLVLFHIALLLIIVFVTVGSVELLGRHRFGWKIALARDVDHRLAPNTAEHNSDGIRCDKESGDFEPGHVNIIFLGDSFVYGRKSHPQCAFPQQFERMANSHYPGLPVHVANFGWLSSSPYLSLRLLRDIGAKYNPDVVFLCIDMTDFHDDLKYEYLRERPKIIYKMISVLPGTVFIGQFILSALSRNDSMARLYEHVFGLPADRFFIVNQPLSRSMKNCRNILSNIDKIHAYVTGVLHAKFILVILPRSFQYSDRECPKNWEAGEYSVLGPYVHEPFTLFDELRKTVSYPVYSWLDDFRRTEVFPTCLYDDPHWTSLGNQVAAQCAFETAENEGVFIRTLNPGGGDGD